MYKKEFDSLDKEFKAYLFWGEEPFYVRRYTKNIAQRVGSNEPLHLYFDEYELTKAKEYLAQNSLFGDRNLLIITHDKALPKKELQEIIELCQKVPNSFFIYELLSNEGKKIASLFEGEERVQVRFFKPSITQATQELQRVAQELGVEIESFTIQHLLHLLEGNLELAAKELEKLSILSNPITAKDIDRLVYPLSSLNLEKFYEALINKEPLAPLLHRLIQEEQNEMRILLGLQNFIRQLFLFYTHIRLYAKAQSKEILGYQLPRHIEEQRAELAMRIKNYPEIFLTLQECEHRLKTEPNIDKSATLFSCLIKIQALI